MNSLKEQGITAIFTIGHSNHPIDKFIEMLLSHKIELIADVRTIPKSRHNPQYNSDALAASLTEQGVEYRHITDLGGLRHARKDSPNKGWENASFRGFADYMETEKFEKSLIELIEAARKQRTALMCAEAVPWRCHRSLIADALAVRRITVVHIMSKTSLKEHAMTPWAVVKGEGITYPKA
jgi:uncharacterized protein (DUF488 family)